MIDRLNDPIPEVRKAAIEAAAQLKIREAIPPFVAVTNEVASRTEAAARPGRAARRAGLAGLPGRAPGPQPRVGTARPRRRCWRSATGSWATWSGRRGRAGSAARPCWPSSGSSPGSRRSSTGAFIGPFPRTTAQVFLGESSIDFTRTHAGVEGRSLAWTACKADPATGRVVLEGLKGGAGDRGGFGYDTNGSPDLNAFGSSDRLRPRSVRADACRLKQNNLITVNETMVYQ